MFRLGLYWQEMGRRRAMDSKDRKGVSVSACHHTANLHDERKQPVTEGQPRKAWHTYPAGLKAPAYWKGKSAQAEMVAHAGCSIQCLGCTITSKVRV